MAEEAFALSPISASAAVPTEADYHAIREAFMETARGRWFLTEYTKRNRNADTAMVLEAVARIEQSISAAAQTEATASAPAPKGLSEAALVALENARTAIRAEFSETGFDHTLLPWRKSSRIIREIVWGLRESGADPRICNILDGQVRAIEAACDEFPLADIRDRILASLDAALPQNSEAAAPVIADSASDEPAAVEISTDTASAPELAFETLSEAAVVETVAAHSPVGETPVAETPAVETVVTETPLVEAKVAEAVAAEIEAAMDVIAPASAEIRLPETLAPETPAPETPSPETASPEQAASEVKALPETAVEATPATVVAEVPPTPVMAAPRSIMTASASQPAPQPVAQPAPAETPDIAASASPPQAAVFETATPVLAAEEDLWADIEAEIAPLPPFDPAHEASLGASLIAQGVVARPSNARADLLAPIRRMSHAERIAFFS